MLSSVGCTHQAGIVTRRGRFEYNWRPVLAEHGFLIYMELQLEQTAAILTVQSINAGADGLILTIDGKAYDRSVILLHSGVEWWPVTEVGALTVEQLGVAATAPIELILLGTGQRMIFPHPRLQAALTARRIGLEVMDTPAACRTYNMLAADGRRVAAALVL